jgi:hypothetical protein
MIRILGALCAVLGPRRRCHQAQQAGAAHNPPCGVPQAVLRPPPTPTRPAVYFPRSSVIGRHAPATLPQVTGLGRNSPVPAATIDTFRAPYAGSPSRLHARICTASMAFTLISGARHSLSPPEDETSNGAAGFASCYGPHRRSPCRALDAGLRAGPFPDRAASLLPGLLAATRTGLPPAGDDELTNTKIHHGTTSRCHLPFCWAHERSRLGTRPASLRKSQEERSGWWPTQSATRLRLG